MQIMIHFTVLIITFRLKIFILKLWHTPMYIYSLYILCMNFMYNIQSRLHYDIDRINIIKQ